VEKDTELENLGFYLWNMLKSWSSEVSPPAKLLQPEDRGSSFLRNAGISQARWAVM